MVHAEYDALDLPDLVERLRDLDQSRTPLGWPTASAVDKSAIERRILELVAEPERAHRITDSGAVLCEKKIRLRTAGNDAIRATSAEVRRGGIFVHTRATASVGEPIAIEIRTDNDYPLKVRGHVDWIAHGQGDGAAGIGVTFSRVAGDGSERRVRRLVFELLRHRVDS